MFLPATVQSSKQPGAPKATLKAADYWLQDNKSGATYRVEQMYCANVACGQLVIRVVEQRLDEKNFSPHASSIPFILDGWIAVPRNARGRPVPREVAAAEPRLSRVYLEAVAVLDVSPRSSAILSRRILADLLRLHGGRTEHNLAQRIDRFNEDVSRPYELRKNLHYLREIGNLEAHAPDDDQAALFEVTTEEAGWTLSIIDELFDYFIVTPERNKAMRTTLDKKFDQAKRKPIKPLPEDA